MGASNANDGKDNQNQNQETPHEPTLSSAFYPTALLSPSILIPTLTLTTSFLAAFYLYTTFLRRIPTSGQVPDSYLKRRSMFGYVTSVGDPDNFRFFHTPGGRLAGWGWLRPLPKLNQRGRGPAARAGKSPGLLGLRSQSPPQSTTSQTLHVRLNGVDAPECAHFGKPAQPYSDEALAWLRSYLLGKRVRIFPLSKDQYQRTVCEARVWTWTGRKNVSAEMLRRGWATVYEAKSGVQFNGHEAAFRRLEGQAKRKRKGMFVNGEAGLETPREYKQKHQ